MKTERSISVPIRQGLTTEERWNEESNALISCWERGREKAIEDPELAAQALSGRLVILPWKGGVERKIKKTVKYGTYRYLAMWQGLRGEDLDIETTVDSHRVCSETGMTVIYTSDFEKFKEA